MRRPVRFALALILCLALGWSGIANTVPAARGADSGIWTHLPLYGGYITSLVLDPSTPSTLYAGTYGGVFRSTDSGATWTACSSGMTSLTVQTLSVDPSTPSTLYAGTYDRGVFRSTDSGATWTACSTGILQLRVWALAINPSTSSTLYAGTWGGVFRSTDSGATWSASSGLPNSTVWSVAIDLVTRSTVYAGTWSGVFRSTDSGATWISMAGGATRISQVYSLGIDPAHPSAVYAGTDRAGIFQWSSVPSYHVGISLQGDAAGASIEGDAAVDIGDGQAALFKVTLHAGYEATVSHGSFSKDTGLWTIPAVHGDIAAVMTVKRQGDTALTAVLTIGGKTMVASGQIVQLEAAPYIKGGRTMLPLRAVIRYSGVSSNGILPSER